MVVVVVVVVAAVVVVAVVVVVVVSESLMTSSILDIVHMTVCTSCELVVQNIPLVVKWRKCLLVAHHAVQLMTETSNHPHRGLRHHLLKQDIFVHCMP